MYQGPRKLSEATAARRRIYFYCVDATDGITPETGEAGGQPQISKNGAAFGNTTNVLVAIANGDYYVELTAAEIDTLGIIKARYKSANTAEAKATVDVVAYDPFAATNLGLSDITAIKAKTDNLPAAPAATGDIPTAAANADAVWDEARSGHVASGSFGQSAQIVRSATAAAGAASGIQLDGSASAVDDIYNGALIFILSGTGAGQSRFISDYNGTTKLATVSRAWATNPDNTSVFLIYPAESETLTIPSAASIADAVWDEDATGHQTAGTFGKAIGDPGAGTDTIYAKLTTNLDLQLTSLQSQLVGLLGTIDDFLDTEIAAIKAKTDNLPSDPADESALEALIAALDTKLDTIDNFIDTEVAAIKAKTDQLTFTEANKVDVGNLPSVTVGTNNDKTGYSLSSAGIDSILDDTPAAELATVPSATASIRLMLQFIFEYLKHKRTVTGSAEVLYKDNGSDTLGSRTVTDDGTTVTLGEIG